MTKSKMAEFFKRFDDEKLNTYKHGVAFELVIHDLEHNSYMHTGIGTGENMSMMNLYGLCALYKYGAHKDVSIELFAESVKQSLIKVYNEDFFGIRKVGGGN